MKKVVQDLTSGGIDWQREKWQSGLGSKFIHQGEKNAAKYADEVIVLSKGVQDYKIHSKIALQSRKITGRGEYLGRANAPAEAPGPGRSEEWHTKSHENICE